jgi:hypothetical protein
MITCITRAVDRRLDRHEPGAATLDAVGMYAVAATKAEYQDGSDWVPWKGCGAP